VYHPGTPSGLPRGRTEHPPVPHTGDFVAPPGRALPAAAEGDGFQWISALSFGGTPSVTCSVTPM